MKLRNVTSKAVAAPRKPIPQIHPAKKTITATNLSSFLIRLPQEIKNQIYGYSLGGGKCIHVEYANPVRNKGLYCVSPCPVHLEQPKASDIESNNDSDVESDSDSDAEMGYEIDFSPSHVYLTRKTPQMLARRNLAPTSLPVNLLRTCRQIYHEASYVLYFANTFSFRDPRLVNEFIEHLHTQHSGSKALVIRHLRLEITRVTMALETAWTGALCTVAHCCTNLSNVDIVIDGAMWERIRTGLKGQAKDQGRYQGMYPPGSLRGTRSRSFSLFAKRPTYHPRDDFIGALSKLANPRSPNVMTFQLLDVNQRPKGQKFLWSDITNEESDSDTTNEESDSN